jgi:transcriptional regulator with XRE-family HTH domain
VEGESNGLPAAPLANEGPGGESTGAEGQVGRRRATGSRPRPSRKPIDPETKAPAKRTEFSIAFGQRLKQARIGPDPANPRFEINDVARIMTEQTGYPWNRQTINTYENGWAVPPVEKLLLLADLYHASLDYLIRGQEAENVHVEQVLDKLPEELRHAMFAIHSDPRLARLLSVVSRLSEAHQAFVLELVSGVEHLTAANLQVLRALSTQLADANKA